MKITLNKTSLVNLSKDNNVLPAELTPQVAGGTAVQSSYPGYTNYTVSCYVPETVNADTCPSDRNGGTMNCCMVP